MGYLQFLCPCIFAEASHAVHFAHEAEPDDLFIFENIPDISPWTVCQVCSMPLDSAQWTVAYHYGVFYRRSCLCSKVLA